MPEKICVVCGEDCSSKPRTKDARGRYYCTPCYQSAISTRNKSVTAAPPPADDASIGLLPPDDAGEMDWLKDALSSNAGSAAAPCPGCGAPLVAGTVVCTACGYNMQTGAKLTVKTYAPPKQRSAPALSAGAFLHPAVVGLAALGIYGLLAVVAVNAASEAGFIVLTGWHVLYSLTVTVLVLVAAFRESIAQGFLTLCVPCYVLYFVFAVADSALLRWLFGANLIGAFVTGAVSAAVDNPGFYYG